MTAAVIRKDEDLWRAAYAAHAGVVLAFLRRRLSPEEAEDVLQETFVRAIRAGSVRLDGNIRAYLLTTAKHVLINRLRRPRLVVAAGDAVGDAEASEEERLSRLARSPENPERDAAWSAFRDRLGVLLTELPEAHRRAFELAVAEQHSYAEVAALTGWSLAQVKINVYRARKRLIEGLGDYLPQGDSR